MELKKIEELLEEKFTVETESGEKRKTMEIYVSELDLSYPRPAWDKKELKEILEGRQLKNNFIRVTNGSGGHYVDIIVGAEEIVYIVQRNQEKYHKIKDFNKEEEVVEEITTMI